MSNISRLVLSLAFVSIMNAPPASASSTAASSASDSVTASVGSVSGSVQASSNSSAGQQRVAQGEYRLIEIAAAATEPDMVRLTLVPAEAIDGDAAQPFFLTVARTVLARTDLAAGATVSVTERPYGLEFAEGQPRRSFFLALHDDWYRELRTTPVVL